MLLDAAIDNNIEVIEQAIEDGVILDDVVDEDGSALLYVALENKHVELIQTIIRTGKCNINRVNNVCSVVDAVFYFVAGTNLSHESM